MTCSAMGGYCEFEITGETAEELSENGKKHVHETAEGGDEEHKAIIATMEALSEEEHAKWKQDMMEKFDTLEDT